MKKFNYKVKDEAGIHARPAGLIVKTAKEFESDITLKLGLKSANAKRLFDVMALGVMHGDDIELIAEGEDEERAIEKFEKIMRDNF